MCGMRALGYVLYARSLCAMSTLPFLCVVCAILYVLYALPVKVLGGRRCGVPLG